MEVNAREWEIDRQAETGRDRERASTKAEPQKYSYALSN